MKGLQSVILPQHQQPITIRLARKNDVDGAKRVAEEYKQELGFVNIAILKAAQNKGWLLVAAEWNFEANNENIIGFANFRIKKDKNCTLYEIAVQKSHRDRGVGKRLLNELMRIVHVAGGKLIRLKCPEELPANKFYERNRFELVETEEGKKRRLNVWQYQIPHDYAPLNPTNDVPQQTTNFFASLTVNPDQIQKLHRLWHEHAHRFDWGYGTPNPFQRILISPVVSHKQTLDFVKELKRTGEAQEVMFDSGGYFVQKGDITYYDLSRKLYEIYKKEDWADIYVLPDNPPLSQDSPDEVEAKIKQTVEGSLRLYKDLPESIRRKTMPVVHATKGEHLDYCLRHYTKEQYQIEKVGFGSFPTSGTNNSINRLNVSALMILRQLVENLAEYGIGLHTFGISTPPAIYLLSLVGVQSFDSNGWMRSGGYGLIFLPFMRGYLVTFNSRRHHSLNEVEFQKWKEIVNHNCPFCASFLQLSKSRWYRIMHNLTVMAELETHHRTPQIEVLKNLSSKYYRILNNLNLH